VTGSSEKWIGGCADVASGLRLGLALGLELGLGLVIGFGERLN